MDSDPGSDNVPPLACGRDGRIKALPSWRHVVVYRHVAQRLDAICTEYIWRASVRNDFLTSNCLAPSIFHVQWRTQERARMPCRYAPSRATSMALRAVDTV